jgi:hypothetical protein
MFVRTKALVSPKATQALVGVNLHRTVQKQSLTHNLQQSASDLRHGLIES